MNSEHIKVLRELRKMLPQCYEEVEEGDTIAAAIDAAIAALGGVVEIRQAVADYMRYEGCGCCANDEAQDVAEKKLAELLNVPMYSDGSGYDFSQFRTAPPAEGGGS